MVIDFNKTVTGFLWKLIYEYLVKYIDVINDKFGWFDEWKKESLHKY
jgi:hypothetical protein